MTISHNQHWVDFHLHTNRSDGTYSPSELIKLAAKKNILTVSITDHDTVNGIDEGLIEAQMKRIKVIPGIEISSKYTKGTLHILGYGINHKAGGLKDKLNRLQEVRRHRNVKIIDKLQSLGIDISIDDIIHDKAELKSYGRPHIASILIQKGVVENMEDAFEMYLGNTGKAFVSKQVLTSKESIQLIHEFGGFAILAHPSTLNLTGKPFIRFLENLIDEGLDGIEVYSSAHVREQTMFYYETAKKYNILISAGSDFHGSNKGDILMGICHDGGLINTQEISQQLLELASSTSK